MKKLSPWFFIPSLYFLEGLPYVLINVVSGALYTKMGIPNDVFVFWTGFLYLPWTLKMFWSPLIDGYSTKRRWLLWGQFLAAAIFSFVAFSLSWNCFFTASLLGFAVGAFVSATCDIATDGYYMLSLSANQQGYFVGIRTIFYRLAMIFGGGTLLMIIGSWEKQTANIVLAWKWGLLLIAGLFVVLGLYHAWLLPRPDSDRPAIASSQGKMAFTEAFKTYFSQKNIGYILLFILFYRLGDAFLEKIITPFLIGPVDSGALGLSTAQLGFIKGTLGLGAIIAGNLAGGWLLGKYGFKKCIWPFAFILILPNFFYAYMAWAKPGIAVISGLIALEHLGNGLAMMAFSIFIMYVSQGPYKTSHYAISTGIMALGMMLPSMLSGKMQVALGYEAFFALCAIFSLITLAIVPLTFKIKSIEETEKLFRENKASIGEMD